LSFQRVTSRTRRTMEPRAREMSGQSEWGCIVGNN
jgi:hypothetical protein